MNDLIVSLIRTYVPLGVGTALTLLASLGITGVDSNEMVSVVTTITIGLYYAVARILETKFPAAGTLLGHKAAPKY